MAPLTSAPALERRAMAERRGSAGGIARHWAVLVVLGGYIGAAFVIPTLANVAITDDWVYYRSVESLLVQHQLRIHDLSSAALVFQIAWGGLFAALLGLSFGALRISTIAIVGASGLAWYGLARELGVSRGRSALGTAAYLFNPLTLALAYTFMTDPHFTALVVTATWLYVRGLRVDAIDGRWVVLGSIAAACALLVRQQGVLVPAGVVGGLLVAGRLRPNRRGLALVLRICAIPAIVTLGFTYWLRFWHGVPWAMTLFVQEFVAAGVGGVAGLLPRLTVIEVVYLGFFVLPIALALLPSILVLWHQTERWSRVAALVWSAAALLGTAWFWRDGLLMPYVGQFVTATGLGPEDLVAARPMLIDETFRQVWTIACVLASMVLGLAVARAASAREPVRVAIAPVVGIAVGQWLGTLPPSVHFITWSGSLDRYLLPLLPLSLVLLLWAVRRLPLIQPVGWVAVVLMSLVAVAGTHDNLAWLDGVWSLGRDANQRGVSDVHLDAGAGWDGFYLNQGVPPPNGPPDAASRPWWMNLFAPETDGSYVVAGAPLPGYAVVEQLDYASWLQRRALPLFLLRKPGVTGPP